MTQRFVRSLALRCLIAIPLLAIGAGPPTTAPITLREAARGRLLIGAAVMERHLEDPAMAALVASQFDCLTPENEFKPDMLQRVQGTFTFGIADRIADFAQAHDQRLIGHTLLWHAQSPAWLFVDAQGKPLPRDVALANLRDHITTVMRHFKGKVLGWDVVNEAVNDGDDRDLRDTPAWRAIGDDYIVQAFRFARAADPSAQLYYNDYNIELPDKRGRALRMLRTLKAENLIDGVGIQGHWQLGAPDAGVIDDAIGAYADLGLKVMITELDVDPLPREGAGADVAAGHKAAADPYKAGFPADVAAAQARRYAEIFKVLSKRPGVVTRVTFWGVHDGTSWLNGYPVVGRTNYPLLFDRHLQPKPAFAAVIDVLSH